MSPKELLYLEDALGHEQFLKTQCQQAAQALQNPQLKQCVSQLEEKHAQLFQKLYGLMSGGKPMNADKEIMENLLNTVKGVCDLYMHGTIESSTQNVHAAFDEALEESLCMQNEIYNQMSQQGWYPMEQAPQQQIDKVRNKFANA